MNQEKFRYALYHDETHNVEDTLEDLDPVKDFEILVSINETGCRGKDPISDKRTTVSIKIEDNYSFEQLDDKIKESFTEIWFEH